MKKVRLIIEPEKREESGDEGYASFGYDNHRNWMVLWSPLTAGQAEDEGQNTERESSAKELAPQWGALTSPQPVPSHSCPNHFCTNRKSLPKILKKDGWFLRPITTTR
ncbi:hypothetical protein OUZ56_023270 [Daphnia magna]|uniref:Uncharacterized protein n=1 Tax=Daphnia magna TaxID=35525 RepID=A0ABR0AYS3_9CRUS|nr:hypothetical protein OUZ56_023270 [Daphnia magna]